MRGIPASLVGALLLAWTSAAAAPDRFDHRAHGVGVDGTRPLCADGVDNDGDRRADARDRDCGRPLPECTHCHRTRGTEQALRGRMRHSACNGCHPIAQLARGGVAPALCSSCHITGRRFRFPPYPRRGEGDFVLARFDHGAHTRGGEAGCAQCHRLTAAAKRKVDKSPEPEMADIGHGTCGESICHGERVAPQMGECTACHVPIPAGTEVPPAASAEWDPYRVAWTFSHVGHARKAGAAPCAKCHTNADVQAAGARVPLPPMEACASCHQGQVAFSTVGTRCGWCHLHPEGARAR